MHTTDLEARVAALEDLSDVMDKLRTATMKNENRRAAENAALRMVVKELAIHAGVTSKDFEGHIKVRKEYNLDPKVYPLVTHRGQDLPSAIC